MRCLVTGVAGFVGSHLARRLVADGHDVVGVDAFVDSYARSLKEANIRELRTSPRFEFLEGDLNLIDLDRILADQEWVFHQAAQAGVRASWGLDFEIYMARNIAATQRLLEAATRATHLQRFVFASSSSVYGNVDELPVTEETATRPVSPYGVTKLAAEHLCSLYGRSFGLPTVSLRYFTVYGPGQRPDMAFHRFGRALLDGTEIVVYGDGSQTRDFTYVSDVVEANVLAAMTPDVQGQVFNVAGGARVSLREAVHALESISGRKARLRFEPAARGDVRDTFADVSRAQHLLGYRPRVSLHYGLAAELAFLADLEPPQAADVTGRFEWQERTQEDALVPA